MERFVKGDVVVIPFPYTDLSSSKRRPALVINNIGGADIIICAITTQNQKDKYCIDLKNSDFLSGSLERESYIRPSHLFTADKSIILYSIGKIEKKKIKEVTDKICKIVRSD